MCNCVEINISQRISIADKTYNTKFHEIKLTNWLKKVLILYLLHGRFIIKISLTVHKQRLQEHVYPPVLLI